MSNINEIEVNGQVFGIKSVDDIYVGISEPTTELKPGIWLKPRGIYLPMEDIGMERKLVGGTAEGDYTLDEFGNLVETTDVSSSGSRATKLFSVFHDEVYKLAWTQNYSSSTTRMWSVYFYNLNKEFINKADFEPNLSTEYVAGNTALELQLPEGTRFVRILCPYEAQHYLALCFNELEASEIASGTTTGSLNCYKYDGDHYVRI